MNTPAGEVKRGPLLPRVALVLLLALMGAASATLAACGTSPTVSTSVATEADGASTTSSEDSAGSLLPSTRQLYPAQQDTKWGYIDATGSFVVAPEFDYAARFSQGLAAVWLNGQPGQGQAGYIDETGQVVIQPRYFLAGPFSEGLAAVAATEGPGTIGFIDKSGEIVIPPTYDHTQGFSEGLAAVMEGSKWGFVDPEGELVIPLVFDNVGSFMEGLARAKRDGLWGYINHTGAFAIEPQFSETESLEEPALGFREGLAPVYSSGQWRYIDKAGRQAFEATFALAGRFNEGLAPVVVSGAPKETAALYPMGFIDTSGRLVIPAEFGHPLIAALATMTDEVGFHNGLAAVWSAGSGGMMGYIDRTGEFAIAPKYTLAYRFDHAIARVEINGQVMLINKAGETVFGSEETP